MVWPACGTAREGVGTCRISGDSHRNCMALLGNSIPHRRFSLAGVQETLGTGRPGEARSPAETEEDRHRGGPPKTCGPCMAGSPGLGTHALVTLSPLAKLACLATPGAWLLGLTAALPLSAACASGAQGMKLALGRKASAMPSCGTAEDTPSPPRRSRSSSRDNLIPRGLDAARPGVPASNDGSASERR